MSAAGSLYLIPNVLGPDGEAALPAGLASAVGLLQHFLVEEERAARRLLAYLWRTQGLHGRALSDRQAAVHLALLNEHTTAAELPRLLAPLRAGQDMGLVSEAGLPAVADPGAAAVALAHQWGVRVLPLAGPSSLVLALAASGLNGQQFQFHGYLPRKPDALTAALRQLEQSALRSGATQLFIEAPYRNLQLFRAVLDACKPDTRLCTATDLTLPAAVVRTLRLREWRSQPLPDLHKRPTVFLLGR